MPNPHSNDAEGEWIELWNNGDAAVNLAGWTIRTKSGDTFAFTKGRIGGREFFLLHRRESKLVLRNKNERVALYGPGGMLVDRSGFLGSAPEGKSFGKMGNGSVFMEPTPGAANILPSVAALVEIVQPIHTPLHKPFSKIDFFGVMFGSAFALTVFIVFVTERNENLLHLFFGRDEEVR